MQGICIKANKHGRESVNSKQEKASNQPRQYKQLTAERGATSVSDTA